MTFQMDCMTSEFRLLEIQNFNFNGLQHIRNLFWNSRNWNVQTGVQTIELLELECWSWKRIRWFQICVKFLKTRPTYRQRHPASEISDLRTRTTIDNYQLQSMFGYCQVTALQPRFPSSSADLRSPITNHESWLTISLDFGPKACVQCSIGLVFHSGMQGLFGCVMGHSIKWSHTLLKVGSPDHRL